MIIPNITIAEELKNLPIISELPNMDLTKDSIVISGTGMGKSMLIPALLAITTKKLVLLREPTRRIAQLTYEVLQRFWGDQIKIGLLTSENKEIDMRMLNSYDLIVMTDGNLSHILKKVNMETTSIIFDEIHWIQGIVETEVSLCLNYKLTNPHLHIVLLSATIDPILFIRFWERISKTPVPDIELQRICALSQSPTINKINQCQQLKLYFSEGVTFPMEKIVIKVKSMDDIEPIISGFCSRMKALNDFGICFLPTRQSIATAARQYFPLCPTLYAHADSSLSELQDFFKNNKSGVVFSTVALSVSATLPLLECLVIDSTNDSIYNEFTQSKVNMHNVWCGNNEILQKFGRIGRTRPGTATLLTTRDITPAQIVPSAVIPPLSKELPISASLIASAHGIDIEKINLLSNLSPSQISRSLSQLKQMKFIEANNTITPLGKRAMSLPLEPQDAKLLLSTPLSYQPLTSAFLSFPSGMFYLLDPSNPSKHPYLHTQYNYDCIPLSKAAILQDAISNKHSLKLWCDSIGLNYKRIQYAIYNYQQIGKKFSKTPDECNEDLLSIDLATASIPYRSLVHILMPKFNINLSRPGNNIDGIYSFFSDPDFFTPVSGPQRVAARLSFFSSSGSKVFGRINDATIIPLPTSLEL